MNILQMTYSLSSGGRRNAIVALSNGLKQFSVNCYAVSLTKENEKNIIQSDDVKIFQDLLFLDKQKSYLLKSKVIYDEIFLFCKKNKIDVIHTHDAASQIIVSIINSRYKRIPHLHTFHRSLEMDTVGIKNRVRNFYANLYTDIITVGSSERSQHYKHNNYFVSKKIVIIPFGIDINKFTRTDKNNFELRSKYKISKETLVLGAVGHFRKEKGIDNILHAYSHFLKNNPKNNTALVIVGTGDVKQVNYLHTLTESLGIQKHVHFVGHDSNIEKWYNLFDIYLHAARKEAFGLVLVEAMSTGIPVVASKVGGIPDIVLHGETGFLVEPNNHAEFSNYITRLCEDKQMRIKFGEYANKVALKKYSIAEYANSYLSLYKKLTKR